MFDMVKIGKNIAKMRKEKGMTQMEVADRMGVSYQAISNWERGETMPDISKLPELANIFEVSIDQILDNQKGTKMVKTFIENNTSEFLQNNEISINEFSTVAPILKTDQADEIFGHLKSKFSMKEIVSIAPFVSTEIIDEYAKKACETEGFSELKSLAPFMSERTIEEYARKAFEKGGFSALKPIAPFLDEDIIEKWIRAGFEHTS
ncbi:helix-turn-helix domain-containing protein [Paenibacillus sp.]|jgi:transcriptional regulator with XRE-family HTH domain|uniref:helix-turn-helix domain-containing protein n=1 Tax=Paenibacillus sp. TaxID=58172 RepID=UPI00282AC813|nr:helix-turn-helix domain-containing protein [Paenibacillus sp.]MDR0267113.1 helix-turn-helix domain-containing protein [Paenibacillus sp.]